MDLKKSKVTSKLSNRQELLLGKLKFFYNTENMSKLLPIINGETKISLRIIDWFVSNYSKKYGSLYIIYKDDNGNLTLNETDEIYKQFNVHHSYKSQLKSFSKKNFDPFCRRKRIIINNKGIKIKTTIGQLNFFKWSINNLIIDYIINNFKRIEDDMNYSFKIIKNVKKTQKRKKREELSKSASRGLLKYNSPIKVEFK